MNPINNPSAYRFGSFTLDCRDERLFGDSGPVSIGQKAFDVLCALLANHGKLVTKDELFESC